MDWGQRNRLSKIIRPKDGRTVMLAVDHGYFMGPTSGLEQLGAMVTPLLRYADTLMVTRGSLRHYIDPDVDIPIVLLDPDLTVHRFTPSAERVLGLSQDKVGRAIMDLKLPLRLPNLQQLLLNVIKTGRGLFIEVQGTAEQAPFDRAALDAPSMPEAIARDLRATRQFHILQGAA